MGEWWWWCAPLGMPVEQPLLVLLRATGGLCRSTTPGPDHACVLGSSGRQIVSRSIHHKFGKCLACLQSTKKGRGGITQQSCPAPSSGRLPIAASPSACCWLAACALVIELRFPLLLARPNLARHATHSSQTPPFCLLRTKHTGPRGSRRARQQPPTSIADDTAAASTRDCERSYS